MINTDIFNLIASPMKKMNSEKLYPHIIQITGFFTTILFLSPLLLQTGCSENKPEPSTEESTMGEMTEPGVAQRRAEREKEFREMVRDPLQTPIEENTGEDEGASVVYGYGEKTNVEILREKPRSPRIGVLGALTGELKFYGNETSNGAELALDEIDARGGIKGNQFELLVYDTEGSIPGTLSGVEAFIDRNVLAVVGAATGEVSFSATKIINENQLIIISAGSRRRLGDTGPYNFRNTLDDTHAVKYLIDYMVKNKKWKNFALFSSLVNDYSIKLTAVFKSELVNQNLNVSHELYFYSAAMSNISEEESDIAQQIAKLKENTPDAIIFTGEGKEARDLVTAMRNQNIDIPLVGSEDLNLPEYLSLKEKAVGTLIYGGFNANSKNPKVHKFVEDYKKQFKETPTRFAAVSYDTVYIVAKAVEKTESLRPSHIREALLSIKDFEGVTGRTSVNETGETVKEPFIFEMMKSDGKYTFVSVREPL